MQLWLTGFMGAGKSTAGRKVARIVGFPFIDCDAELEREHGPIAAIFKELGEERFRELESAKIAELAGSSNTILAAGGGAVLNPANRNLMRKDGVIVYLAISPAGALARVAHRNHRPILGPVPDLQTISAVFAQRAAAYADHDLRVAVEGKAPAAIAHIIARWFRRRLGLAAGKGKA
ncbi:MAG TPA: shikimate kinase [Candidatus Eremiobacteraceae bacterium]|nr:shikimate kinase [Candidatus Eremiobacteraceae bacterium]